MQFDAIEVERCEVVPTETTRNTKYRVSIPSANTKYVRFSA